MTDPTTRYPLPDEPGSDPLGATPPPVEVEPDALTSATATATGNPAPTEAAPAAGAGAAEPPPAAPPPTTGWQPVRQADGENRWPGVIFGLILIVVGLWFLAEVTLGIDLPNIRWGQLWPLILIIVGALILWGSRLGRSR